MGDNDIYPATFPFRPHFVELLGHRVAYLDAGRGDTTLLMVHGNPVSGYVYGRLMQELVAGYRCVAPDLLGFGLSDKPPREADYSLEKHIAVVTAFVRALDLRNVVLVVHDWGGPIGLAAAVREPERYTHLVILNTLTEVPMRISPVYRLPFHILLRTPRLAAYLIKQRNLFQRLGIAIMDPEDRAVYERANHSAATRGGIAAFPRLIPYTKNHPSAPLVAQILRATAAWPIPALVLFSDHDSVFSAGQGARFAARLRHGRFRLVSGPKHFLQYEAPRVLAAEIKTFLRATAAQHGSAPP